MREQRKKKGDTVNWSIGWCKKCEKWICPCYNPEKKREEKKEEMTEEHIIKGTRFVWCDKCVSWECDC